MPVILSREIDSLNPPGMNRLNIDDFYLTGDFISDNLLNKLKEQLNVSLNLINPFKELKIQSHLDTNEFISKRPYAFSSAAGIALRMI